MVGEIYTLLLIATALGMDAFSLSLGIGMTKLRFRQILLIGVQIGIFHVWMPLLGMIAGNFLSGWFGTVANLIGGLLIIVLGLEMLISSFRKKGMKQIRPYGIGLWLFGLTVSFDSFSVGLTFGIYGVKILLVLICFGAVSAFLTWLGLFLGRSVSGWLGEYSMAFGGALLLSFGVKLIFFN